ncbi:EpsG family protein [Vibrio cyclitrophicus]
MKLFAFFLCVSFLSLIPFIRSDRIWLVSFLTSISVVIISILFSFTLAERTIYPFTDSGFYLDKALNMKGIEDIFSIYNNDYIFWLFSWLAINLGGREYFFELMGGGITMMMIYSLYISCNKITITKKFFIVSILLLFCTPTYYLQTTNTIRQGMVLPIIFFAFIFLAERRFALSCFLIFLCFFIHGQSAMMTLPAMGVTLYLANKKITFSKITFILLIGILSQSVILVVLKSIGLDVYVNKMMLYQDSWDNDNNFIKYAISISIVYFYFYISRALKSECNDKFDKLIFKPYLSLMLISIIVYPFGEVAARFLSIVSIFEIMVMIYILSLLAIKFAQGQIFIPFTIIGCTLLFLLVQYHPSIIHNLNNVSIYYE